MTDSSYEKWLDLYGDLYDAPALLTESACPNCATIGRLEVVFAVRDNSRDNCLAYFWCGNCLMGIGPLRAPLPESGWEVIRKGTERVPNYTLVLDE